MRRTRTAGCIDRYTLSAHLGVARSVVQFQHTTAARFFSFGSVRLASQPNGLVIFSLLCKPPFTLISKVKFKDRIDVFSFEASHPAFSFSFFR
jgi:hypothetical protein